MLEITFALRGAGRTIFFSGSSAATHGRKPFVGPGSRIK
jgi:hypothetical protein